MIVYIIATTISIIMAKLSGQFHIALKFGTREINPIVQKYERPDKLLLFLSFLPLFFVSAFRYMVGTDYGGVYRYTYYRVISGSTPVKYSSEGFYAALNVIASKFSGDNYEGVFFFSSLLICGFVFAALWHQSNNIEYSVLLWVISGMYFTSFNAVRQFIAMSIFLYGIRYINEDSPFKYALTIFLAGGFHRTAFLMLPLYFIKYLKIKVRYILLFLVVVTYYRQKVFQAAAFLSLRIPIFHVYWRRYLGDGIINEVSASTVSHASMNLAFMVLFHIIAYVYDRDRKRSNLWCNLQTIAFLISLMASFLPFANRLSRWMEIALLISIPQMTGMIEDNKTVKLLIDISIIICYIAYVFLTFVILGYHDVLPYRTIFTR